MSSVIHAEWFGRKQKQLRADLKRLKKSTHPIFQLSSPKLLTFFCNDFLLLSRANSFSINWNLRSFLPAHLRRTLPWHCLTPTTCTSAFVFSFPRGFFLLFLFSSPSLALFQILIFTPPPPPFCLPLWQSSDLVWFGLFLYTELFI